MEVTLSKIAALENFGCSDNSCKAEIQAGSNTAPYNKQIQISLPVTSCMKSYRHGKG